MTGARTTMLVLFVAVGVAGGVSHADAASREVPAARYVHKFCVAFSTLDQRLLDRTDRYATHPMPRRLQERKRVLRSLVRDLVRYARTGVNSIKRAGIPAVPHGAHIAAAVRSRFHDTLTGLERTLTAVNRMPTSSRTAFGKAAENILFRVVDAASNVVLATVTVSDSPALDAVASRDPACQ